METCWKFIMEETETGYYCILCGCDVFGTDNVENHFHGKRHADSLDKYGKYISIADGQNQYYCNLCECTISGYIHVRDHITGQQHNDFLENSEEESDTSGESDDESDTSNESVEYDPMESDDFVSRYSDTDEYICNLCNEEFENRGEANCHLQSRNHRKTFKIYGSKILSSGSGSYYCELCNCYMNSLKNVYDHLNGLRHENNM